MIDQWRQDPAKFVNKKWRYYPDKFITVNGIRTRYWDVGRGKKTLVLIHGFTGSVEEWAWNIIPLARTYRVIAFDLPGYGRSGKPDVEYNYELYLSHTGGVLKALKIRTALLMGHSMGANISLYFSLKNPRIVEKLVLVAPPLDQEPAVMHKLLSIPFLGEYFMKPAATKKALEDSWRGLTYDPCRYAEVTLDRNAEFQSSPGYARATLRLVRNYFQPFGYTGEARKVFRTLEKMAPSFRKPVFIVWGRQDLVVPFRASEYALKLLPDAVFWPVDKCGHAPLWEYPDEFNRRTLKFLSVRSSSHKKR